MFFYHPNIGSTWMIISVRISGFEDPELAHIMDGAQKVGWLGWLWKSGNHTRNKGRCAPSFSILHTCIILYHCLSVYRLLYVLLLKGWKVWGCHQMQLPKRWENPKSGMKLHFSWFNRYTPRGKLCCASWGP
jgi:hypothetical protein